MKDAKATAAERNSFNALIVSSVIPREGIESIPITFLEADSLNPASDPARGN